MTTPDDATQKIEAYLSRLRQHLRGVDSDYAREIIAELRSHISERAAESGEVTSGAVDAALAKLGSPEELASQYATDHLLERTESSRSPLRVLESLFRWASLSAAGLQVLLASMLGYFLGVCFVICAASKLFHPRTAGLWLIPDGAGSNEISLRLGFGSTPVGGHEVLGWWMVPVGLIAGSGLVLLTTHFALWCARQYRRSQALPGRS